MNFEDLNLNEMKKPFQIQLEYRIRSMVEFHMKCAKDLRDKKYIKIEFSLGKK